MTVNKHVSSSNIHSYKFAIQCFFGYAGCDYLPGLRGSIFIAMYVISYIGSGLLIRYAEGATYLAVVQVSDVLSIIIGASLSEPHINSKAVRELYI